MNDESLGEGAIQQFYEQFISETKRAPNKIDIVVPYWILLF